MSEISVMAFLNNEGKGPSNELNSSVIYLSSALKLKRKYSNTTKETVGECSA